jgi:sigma-B regulation protein RsbU (phosphoserine phosphatase)
MTKVLAIEDQPVAAAQLVAVLKSLGYQAEHVVDSENAWARLMQGGFRIVVSDWRLPGIDGLELCRMIRQRGGDYVYFILISVAGMTRENRKAALEAGVDDFLPKPIDSDELGMRLHVAERILGYAAQVQQLESILPICGYCKKVREDSNYWSQVEDYLTKRDRVRFSHSVCPDCYDKVLLPQLEKMGIPDPRKKPSVDEVS